jgi:hypothetical protein
VNESVRVALGVNCSFGISISVKARAALPYDNNAHPRILPRVFWSTVLSLVDTVPYREISIMQGRDNDNMKHPDIEVTLP